MSRDRWQKQGGQAAEGRLLARPIKPIGAAPPGLQALGLDGKRDGLLYVPASYQANRPAPLVLPLEDSQTEPFMLLVSALPRTI